MEWHFTGIFRREYMTTDDITVQLDKREVLGKGLAKLRHDGLVPAVIHDHGKDSIHVMGDFAKLVKVFSTAGKHHPVQLKVDGKQHLALIKDVDFEPTKHRMRHVVFQAIKQNEAVEAEIPVTFVADAEIPAEKVSLLVLKQLDHVEVKALPKDLPDELQVDPSVLAEVGDNLTVADIKAPEGVTILTPPETQIAIVEMPKDQIAEADAAAAALAEDAGVSEEPETEAPADEKTEAGEEE
jgi:large subunit ribosomal protein L25